MRATPYESYYAASKAAAARYLACLAHETRPHGVHLKYLCPGFIDTGFFEPRWFGMAAPRVVGSGVGPVQAARAAIALIENNREFDIVGWRERIVVLADRIAPDMVDRWLGRKKESPR